MKKEKKIYVIIGGSSDFSCSEMVHYQRLKSGPRNIASQRVRRASLCSPFLLPSISAVCPWGIPQDTLHGGLPLTGSITVL